MKRRKISESQWAEIRMAYASGLHLRELARNMKIPAGTVLARAKREGWTRQIEGARALVSSVTQSNAITPMQSAAISMQERGRRYTERVAGLTEKTLPHLEALPPNEFLSQVDKVEKLDRIARRNFGLDEQTQQPMVSLNILSVGAEAFIERTNMPQAVNLNDIV